MRGRYLSVPARSVSTMTEPRTYPAGVTSWIDLETSDLEAAQEFYGRLFGWTFSTATPPGVPAYVIARLDGQDAAGLTGGAGTPAWSTYVAVDDIDQAARAVEEAGGHVTSPP